MSGHMNKSNAVKVGGRRDDGALKREDDRMIKSSACHQAKVYRAQLSGKISRLEE